MTSAKDILQKSYTKVDVKDTISSLLGKMRKSSHHAVVFDGTKYKGILGKRFLLSTRIDPSKTKVGNVIKHRSKAKTPFFVPTLSLNTNEIEMAKLFTSSAAHILPVVKDKKVVGIVRSIDLAKVLAPNYKGVPCDRLASMNLIMCKALDKIDKALGVMLQKGIDNLPVVDKDGYSVGIVTLGDLIDKFRLLDIQKRQRLPRAAGHQGGGKKGYGSGEKTAILNLPVENAMTKAMRMCCTKPDTTVPRVITTMASRDVQSIVLLEDEEPVGIFTVRDLFKDFVKRLR